MIVLAKVGFLAFCPLGVLDQLAGSYIADDIRSIPIADFSHNQFELEFLKSELQFTEHQLTTAGPFSEQLERCRYPITGRQDSHCYGWKYWPWFQVGRRTSSKTGFIGNRMPIQPKRVSRRKSGCLARYPMQQST